LIEMNEFLEQFLVESRELVEVATRELLALEQAPEEKDRLDGVFRTFHTLKGCAGIVDFSAMSRTMNIVEEALSAVRKGDASISPDFIGDCLKMIDQVAQWLDEIQATGDLPSAPDQAADATVARFKQHERAPAQALPAQDRSPDSASVHISPPARRVLDEQLLLIADSDVSGRTGRIVAAGRVAGNVLRFLSRHSDVQDVERAVSFFLTNNDAAPLTDAIGRLLGANRGAAPIVAPEVRSESAARSLRVDAERVDALVALTGELIVAKNAIAHIARSADESGNALAHTLRDERARLDRLLARLQETVLNLRVVPLRTVFQRFQRAVRELAIALGKPTTLVIEGEDTETDRTIAEMLFEPLLHIVRNAMDHGIEPERERATTGKPPIATIGLRAHRDGENVVIEISDDGKGIDVERVRSVAEQQKVVESGTLSAATEQDILDLIFMPGFSTRDTVSDVSGRGVGMDAVRSVVERIGGSVAVESKLGHGATFRLTLPFSVMVTRVMTVETRGQVFGIPLDAIVESLRVPRARIQPIGSVEAFVLRDRTIPLIDLATVLGSQPQGDRTSDVIAVVVSVAGQLGAMEVDRLGERMDVILRPFDGLLAGAPGIAGVTLMGDGQVLLVLDLGELLV
jgi:two-component system, chemotaxis family, sensor kinase CheA